MEQVSMYEDKGRYCQFVLDENGKYILKPVKIPAHVIAEREERLRRIKQQKQLERNRARAMAMNASFVVFMTLSLAILITVCCVLLTFQSRINTRMNSIASLQHQIESLAEDNDVLQKRLDSYISIHDVAALASEDYGMERASMDQIYFYSASGKDYMLQYKDVN